MWTEATFQQEHESGTAQGGQTAPGGHWILLIGDVTKRYHAPLQVSSAKRYLVRYKYLYSFVSIFAQLQSIECFYYENI